MNILMTVIFSEILWAISSQKQLFTIETLTALGILAIQIVAALLLARLPTFAVVQENQRKVLALTISVMTAITYIYFTRSVEMRSASVGWYLLYFSLTPAVSLLAVGIDRSVKNYLIALLSIVLVTVAFFASSLVIVILSSIAMLLVISKIEVKHNVINASLSKTSLQRELIGFPVVLQTTSLSPRDWYYEKGLRR